MSLRAAGCRDCEQVTSGDCGRHGPILWPAPVIEYSVQQVFDVANAYMVKIAKDLQRVEQERDTLRAGLQQVIPKFRDYFCHPVVNRMYQDGADALLARLDELLGEMAPAHRMETKDV